MKISIMYKNNAVDEFEEKQLDCCDRTIKGHANYLIEAWKSQVGGVYRIDNYNAVLLDEIVAVRVI